MSAEKPPGQNDTDRTTRYRIMLAGETLDTLAPENIVRGKGLTEENCEQVEKKCGVIIRVDKPKGKVVIIPDADRLINKNRTSSQKLKSKYRPETARKAVAYILEKTRQLGEVSENSISKHINQWQSEEDAAINELDARKLKREITQRYTDAQDHLGSAEALRQDKIIPHDGQYKKVTADEDYIEGNANLMRLLETLDKKDKLEATLAVFSEDPRLATGIYAEKIHNLGKPNTFRIDLKIYDNGTRTPDEERQNIVLKILSKAGQNYIDNQVSYDRDKLQDLIDGHFDSKDFMPEKKQEEAKQGQTRRGPDSESTEVSYRATDKITSLNGTSVEKFAEYLKGNNRTNALSAFSEFSELGFTVALNYDDDTGWHFDVTRYSRNGVFEQSQLLVAEYLLAELRRKKFAQNVSITRKYVKEFLSAAIPELQHSSDKKLGDRLKTVFARTAHQDGVSFSHAKTGETGQGKQSDKTLHTYELTDLGGTGERPDLPVNFDIPQFETDEENRLYLPITDERGVEKKYYPTDNQLDYINSIRDPDKQIVLCQGIPGTAKTFWSVYCALDMLKRGAVDQIYFERPFETVSAKNLGALPGGLDNKLDPYNAVIENKFIEILGNGNHDTGKDIFQHLQSAGAIERFNGLFSAGRTVNYGIILVDEAQDKDEGEIWNLLTRPSDSAKIVISGDFETQIHLRKRHSGFEDYFSICRNLPFASTVMLGPEDSVRSKHIAALYEARQKHMAEKKKRETKQSPVPPRPQ